MDHVAPQDGAVASFPTPSEPRIVDWSAFFQSLNSEGPDKALRFGPTSAGRLATSA